MLKRILKNIGALAAGQGIHFLTQFLLPPAFIDAFGLAGYGEWLVLFAAVSYLSTLDFGMYNYVVNELTILYHAGKMDQFRTLQSTALLLVLGIALLFSFLALVVFVVPFHMLLDLSVPPEEATRTLYLLALQILWSILFGHLCGVFRVFGQAHRGAMWANAQRLLILSSTLILVVTKSSFHTIALAQLLAVFVTLVAVTIDLRRKGPHVFPSLQRWNPVVAKSIVKPSIFFSLFIANNYLLYQVPLLLINYFSGSTAVASFGVARTIFSFVRGWMSTIHYSLAPEISRLYGIGDRAGLGWLYTLSQSVILSSSVVFNSGVLAISPLLLKLWLGRTELFEVHLFVLLMIASILSSLKEFKLYLHFATNTHREAALLTSLSYLGMVILAIPLIKFVGVRGFVLGWIAAELVQIVPLHRFNSRLLRGVRALSLKPVLRMSMTLAVLACAALFGFQTVGLEDYALQGAISLTVMMSLLVLSYFLFDLRTVWTKWRIYSGAT